MPKIPKKYSFGGDVLRTAKVLTPKEIKRISSVVKKLGEITPKKLMDMQDKKQQEPTLNIFEIKKRLKNVNDRTMIMNHVLSGKIDLNKPIKTIVKEAIKPAFKFFK